VNATGEQQKGPTGESSADPRGAYTQINVLFPSPTVELPSAEKFNAFSEEAQKTILAAFRVEQQHRHNWMTTQQKQNHELNLLRQRHAFITRIVGMIIMLALTITIMGFGVWLVSAGATGWGASLIIASAAGLIGTAIYGHKARSSQAPPSEPFSSVTADRQLKPIDR
jgi:uncharacterized membrane protein